jgi:2,3-bisphosphoglycerate-independent phosphoglycerate mutase
MKKTPTILCILDGFGLNPDREANAVLQAVTPNFNTLWETYPHQQLITHGERVGLPAGQMGNSEVGHLNIGAGRVVEQWLTRISRLLREGQVPSLPAYQQFLEHNKNRTIHLLGLVSNGGVHAHIDQIILTIQQLRKDFSGKICIHAITDGRDTPPQSGLSFIETLLKAIAPLQNVVLASVIGRLYAMDRDTRWERTQKSYDLLTQGTGASFATAREAIEVSYRAGINDEFIEPITLTQDRVTAQDAIIFCNFRDDRMRQIVPALCDPTCSVVTSPVKIPKQQVLCFTEYDQTFDLPVLFAPQSLSNHLGEVVSRAGKTQMRIAETEKYPHVTFFMNGKVEEPYPGEDRVMIPSPRDVKTYDLKPEMSAAGVTKAVTEAIESQRYDLIVINYANPDMVGHCGNLEAAITAVEVVDKGLGEIIAASKKVGANLLVLADHGNAELMMDYQTRQPYTAHTTFPVPVILAQFDSHHPALSLRDNGSLCDVAPTLLSLLGIAIPPQMTGKSLIQAGQ